jgi:hypothetical protein
MKKMLITTLALSLAAVSMVDAKSRSGRKMAPAAAMSKTDMARENLVALMEEMKEATANKEYKAARKLLEQVKEEAMKHPDMVKSIAFYSQKIQLNEEISQLKAELKAAGKNQNWFAQKIGWSNAEQSRIINQLKEKRTALKALESDIQKEAAKVGADSSNIAAYVAGSVAVTAIALATDWYFETGYGKAAYDTASENMPTIEGAKGLYKRVAPGFMGGEAAAK